MSLDGLRGLLSEQSLRSERTSPSLEQTNQVVRRSAGVQGSQVTLSVNAQRFFATRAVSNSINQTLSLSNVRPNFQLPEASEDKSLFDFEQVAQNVLRFVGGVITRARDSGADEGELSSLFEQARAGVSAGIAGAEQELGDALNEEISQGIVNSRERIEEGLQALERNIFGAPEGEDVENDVTSINQSIQIQNQNRADLRIRTGDGDEIEISFDSLRAIQLEQSVIIEQARSENTEQSRIQSNDLQNVASNQVTGRQDNTEGQTEALSSSITQETGDDSVEQPVEQLEPSQSGRSGDTSSTSATQIQVNELRFQQEGFSLLISGELDESELVAVGDLLRDVTNLADEFFNGDIESAFNQALDLGFDDEELIGFALELTQVEQVQVVQTYQSVSQFTDSTDEAAQDLSEDPRANLANIGQYLERIQRVFNPDSVVGPPSIDEFVSSILERISDNNVPNLGISRFNQFNQRLLNNLPNS